MDVQRIIQDIIDGITLPIVIIDKALAVKYLNAKAVECMKIDLKSIAEVRSGMLLQCGNALKAGHCNTSYICKDCSISEVIEIVLETKKTAYKQVGTINFQSDQDTKIWHVSFDASFVQLDESLVMLTMSALQPSAETKEGVGKAKHRDARSECFGDPYNLKTEASLNAIFTNARCSLLYINPEGQITKWNRRFLSLIGLEEDAVITADDLKSEMLKVTSESGLFNFLNQVPNNNVPNETIYGTIHIGNGTSRTIQTNIIPYSNSLDEYQGLMIRIEDFTEKKSLENSMALHRYALEYAPSEFYYLNRSGEIVYANKRARELTGLDFNTTPRKQLSDINPVENINWWTEQISKLEDKAFVEIETFHPNARGNRQPVVAHIFRPDIQQDELFCYYCHNISDHQNLKDSLLKESRVNASMAEISRELTRYNNIASVELLVRQYALEITESPFAFVSYIDPITNESKISIYSDTSENYAQQIGVIEKWYRKSAPNDMVQGISTDLIVNDSSSFLVNGKPMNELLPFNRFASVGIFYNGEYKGLIFVAGHAAEYPKETTERMGNLANLFALAINRIKESKQLMDSLEQLQLAMDVANISIWDAYPVRNEIVVQNVSKQSHLMGQDKYVYSLSDVTSMVHPDDIGALHMVVNEHRNSNSHYFRHEFRLCQSETSISWCELYGRILEVDASGNVQRILGVASDITDRMQLNSDMLKSREDALAANKAKSDFLARISHEFRTPLNAIIGFADLLRNNIKDPVQESYISSIKASGNTLMNLITDILDYSKLEAGKLILKESPVEMRSLIGEISLLFAPLVAQKQLTFKVSIDENLPETIFLDELKVKQILTNLVSNAIKFTEDGGVEIYVTATNVRLTTTDLSIMVVDTGIGIKVESQATIFDDFTQQDDLDSRRYGGTGLGLGIVRRLVELMNGRIDLESYSGIGSKFTVHLFDCRVALGNTNPDLPNIESVIKPDLIANSPGLPQNTISEACKSDLDELLKNVWINFSYRPSFKQVPSISLQIREIANRHNDGYLNGLADRMDRAIKSFDVEELNACISDFELYTRINE